MSYYRHIKSMPISMKRSARIPRYAGINEMYKDFSTARLDFKLEDAQDVILQLNHILQYRFKYSEEVNPYYQEVLGIMATWLNQLLSMGRGDLIIALRKIVAELEVCKKRRYEGMKTWPHVYSKTYNILSAVLGSLENSL